MTTRTGAKIAAVVMALALLAAACGKSSTKSSTAKPTPAASGPAIKLGFSAWPGWFPWQVAKDKGFFDQAGVNVELTWFESYLDSLNALAGGKLDANTQTLNDTISSVAGGAGEVIVLVNDNSTGNDQIIVSPDIKTVADLKGKKVAAEQGTVDHYLLLLGLQKNGLGPSDVSFQPLETGAAAAAFASNRLDGVGVFAPFTTQALKRSGSHALFTSADFPGAIPDHLTVTKSLVEKRPADVQKLVDVWFKTLSWIKANKTEAVSIMAKRAGVSTADYETYDKGTTIFTLQQNLDAFAPGKDIYHLDYAAKQISDFLLSVKLIEKAPDLAGMLNPAFVKGAKP
jgi:NitT/TauT family transport system substrate-binding protein